MVSVTKLIYEFIFPLEGKFKPLKEVEKDESMERGTKLHRKIEKLLRRIKNGESVEAVLSADRENDDKDEEELKHILLKHVFQGKAERDVTTKIREVEYYVESDNVNGRIDAVFLVKSKDGKFDRKNVVIYDWKFINGEDPSYLKNDLKDQKRRIPRAVNNVNNITYHNMNAAQLNFYRVLYTKQEELGRDAKIKMKLFYITPSFEVFENDIEIMEEVEELLQDEARMKKLLYDKPKSGK